MTQQYRWVAAFVKCSHSGQRSTNAAILHEADLGDRSLGGRSVGFQAGIELTILARSSS
jgi:hypothetical protein